MCHSLFFKPAPLIRVQTPQKQRERLTPISWGFKQALKLGYRLIDTAHIYKNEEDVGRAIKDSGVHELTPSIVPRPQV